MEQEAGGRRALLVTSDSDVLDTMKRALNGGDFTVVGEAWPGIEAVQRAGELKPDVVLLHVEPPLGPATRTVQGVGEASPESGIAVLSSAGDLDTIRRVMNSGAHDFAVLPLDDDELCEAARRALASARRRTRAGDPSSGSVEASGGTIVTVAGPRGGVGKTTLAVNLAIALAQETGVPVALADLDLLFGSAAIMLGIMPSTTLNDWLKTHSTGQIAPVGRYLAEHRSGIKLLAAPMEPDPTLDFGPTEVAALTRDLASTHEFVVIDTGASFSEVTAAAIEMSSIAMLLTSTDLTSLRAVRYVVQTLREWEIDDERLHLTLNSPVPFSGLKVEEVNEAVGLPVGWELPHDRAVPRSADLGTPVCLSKRRSPFARRVREMARFVGGIRDNSRKKLLGVI